MSSRDVSQLRAAAAEAAHDEERRVQIDRMALAKARANRKDQVAKARTKTNRSQLASIKDMNLHNISNASVKFPDPIRILDLRISSSV